MRQIVQAILLVVVAPGWLAGDLVDVRMAIWRVTHY